MLGAGCIEGVACASLIGGGGGGVGRSGDAGAGRSASTLGSRVVKKEKR